MSSSQGLATLLSIDGGGVRGLAAIVILEQLMEAANFQRKKKGLEPQEPWQIFDIIGGTSTGGLIAIMLGRLRMSLKDCKAAYMRLSEQAFTHHNLLVRVLQTPGLGPKFQTAPLETAIMATISEASKHLIVGPEAALLKDEHEDGCKVFVVSHIENISGEAAILRSYRNITTPIEEFETMLIWQACRATTAATTFFEPLQIGKTRYSDGGLLYNNPVQLVHEEGCAMFPDREILLISLGTGIASNTEYKPNILTVAGQLADLNTQTKKDADRFFKRDNSAAFRLKRYFRFDIPGLGDIEMDEAKRLHAIQLASNQYLKDPEVGEKIKSCSEQLAEAYAAHGDVATIAREISRSLEDFAWNPRHDEIEVSYRKTFDWIWTSQQHGFLDWFKSGQGIFWISGKPGSGKSTLMKFILSHQSLQQHLRSEQGRAWQVVHYFFHELSELDTDQERSIDGLLHAILSQFLELYPSLVSSVSNIYERSIRRYYAPGRMKSTWSVELLKECLANIAQQTVTHGHIWLFIDGLDECQGDNSLHLELLINWIEAMTKSPLKVQLCISSRDIPALREKLVTPNLELHLWTANDISVYVRDMFDQTKRETISLNAASHGCISRSLIDQIVNQAEGVFMWVQLVVANLVAGLADGDEEDELQARVEALPKDLEKIYADIIRKIPDNYLRDAFNYFRLLIRAPGQKCTLTLLQFLIAAQKPQEAIGCQNQYQCSDFDQGVMIEKQALMKVRLRSRCGNLVSVQARKFARTRWDAIRRDKVVFIHRTVRDFLQKPSVQTEIHGRIEALGQTVTTTVDTLLMASCLRLLKTQPCYIPCWVDARFKGNKLPGSPSLQGKQRESQSPSKDVDLPKVSYENADDDSEYEEEVDSTAPDNLITKFFNYAQNLEYWLKEPQTLFIDEMNRVLLTAHKDWAPIFFQRRTLYEIPDIDILCLAICWKLKLYVKATLSPQKFREKRHRPLLFYAMNPPGWTHEPVDLEMLGFLLEFGTKTGQKPDFIFKENGSDKTIWGHTLWHYLRIGTAHPLRDWDIVLGLMLEHGADPNQRVSISGETFTSALHLLINQYGENMPGHNKAKIGKAVRLLFSHEAAIDIKDSDGIQVDEYAELKGKKIANFLARNRQAAMTEIVGETKVEVGTLLRKRKRTSRSIVQANK